MSDGIWDGRQSVRASAAGLIRSCHSGLCSGEPRGIWYPGVPTPDELVAEAGVTAADETSEEVWMRLCEALLGKGVE